MVVHALFKNTCRYNQVYNQPYLCITIRFDEKTTAANVFAI
jgi:hypothetical protein